MILFRKFKKTFIIGAIGNLLIFSMLYLFSKRQKDDFIILMQLIFTQIPLMFIYILNFKNFTEDLRLKLVNEENKLRTRELKSELDDKRLQNLEKSLVSIVPKNLNNRIMNHVAGEVFREKRFTHYCCLRY